MVVSESKLGCSVSVTLILLGKNQALTNNKISCEQDKKVAG